MIKICVQCENEFETNKHSQLYCGRICFYKVFKKVNLRRKQTKEHIEKLRATRVGRKWTDDQRKKILVKISGKNHHQYKGENAGYRSIHLWVQKRLGKPTECEKCGKTGDRIHLASKSHQYKRDLDDWIALCAKCHWKYDQLNKLRPRAY